MGRFLFKFSILSLLCWSLLAGEIIHAGKNNEFAAGSSGSFFYSKTGSTEVSGYDLSLSCARKSELLDYLQFSADAGASLTKVSGSNGVLQNYSLFVGPVFNFSKDLKEAIFVKPQAGFFYTRHSSSDNFDFSVVLSAGARKELSESVSYRPSVSFYFVDTKNADTYEIRALPISFSFFLD